MAEAIVRAFIAKEENSWFGEALAGELFEMLQTEVRSSADAEALDTRVMIFFDMLLDMGIAVGISYKTICEVEDLRNAVCREINSRV